MHDVLHEQILTAMLRISLFREDEIQFGGSTP